ncbi:MAG: L,D-transpeptidase family protein [Desulfobacteraceae bacterium]|nr:L,D-transpeptidase family protein [Desulfobacteraceae bacterium]
MRFSYDGSVLKQKSRRRSTLKSTLLLTVVIALSVWGILTLFLSQEEPVGEGDRPHPVPLREKTAEAAETERDVSDPWAGPVLYHEPEGQPIYLVLVEKDLQKLRLYRFDGSYSLVKTYNCGTGEKRGRKREENDEKTPVGIYFNDRTFRDREITVFGDRAFGLTYPDPFDRIEGNRGSGIFIHGSNRKVKPYSSNGCIAMDNVDIADLDDRVDLRRTPVIIGDRLPYRFTAPQDVVRELIPFFKQALVPERHAGRGAEVRQLTVLRYRDRTVVMGEVSLPGKRRTIGLSRLYLAGPNDRLLVLLKREWGEQEAPVVAASAPTPAVATAGPSSGPSSAATAARSTPPQKRIQPSETEAIGRLVEAWRDAWQSKRLEEYIGYYHPSFSSKGRDRTAWKAYKGNLNRKYRSIRVGISGLQIRVDGGRAKAYFRQRYRSDTFKADSYKTLLLRKDTGSWKIYRENASANRPQGWPG